MTRTVLAADAEVTHEPKPLPKPSADVFGFAKPGPSPKKKRFVNSFHLVKARSDGRAKIRMRRFKPPVVIAGEAVADEC